MGPKQCMMCGDLCITHNRWYAVCWQIKTLLMQARVLWRKKEFTHTQTWLHLQSLTHYGAFVHATSRGHLLSRNNSRSCKSYILTLSYKPDHHSLHTSYSKLSLSYSRYQALTKPCLQLLGVNPCGILANTKQLPMPNILQTITNDQLVHHTHHHDEIRTVITTSHPPTSPWSYGTACLPACPAGPQELETLLYHSARSGTTVGFCQLASGVA